MKPIHAIAVAFVVLSASACAATRPYTPLQASLDVPSTLRAQAIQEYILDEDLYVIHRNPQWTYVEAISRPRGSTRNRIRIDSTKPQIEISLWTELRTHDGAWLRASQVCTEYQHSREQEVAKAIRHRIRRYLLL
jgi:hypothetical protein